MGKEQITRREIFKTAGAFGLSYLLRPLLTLNASEQTANKVEPEYVTRQEMRVVDDIKEQEKKIEKDEGTSLLSTVGESILVTYSKAVVVKVADSLKFPITPSNNRIDKELREQPAKLFMEAAIGAPLLEEGMFRLLPDTLFMDYSKNSRWDIGIPSALLFAYMHNIRRKPFSNELTLIKDKFPLPQFVGGIYCWYLQRKRGYMHAVTGHAVNNSIVFLHGVITNKLSHDKLKAKKYD